MRDWTVLVTVAQAESQPAITTDQSRQMLDALGSGDSWRGWPG